MTQNDVLAGLADILHDVAGVQPHTVTPDKSFGDDLDVDSLSMVEVIVAAEQRFGVRIPDRDAEGLRTVQDALDYIGRQAVPA